MPDIDTQHPAPRRVRRLAGVSLLALSLAAAPVWAGDDEPVAHRADDDAIQWGPCPPFFAAGCEIGVLHGDPAQPRADVFFRVPGNYDLPHHTHTSAERMVLVQGRMRVDYDGHPPVMLEPGTYAWGPPQMPHRGRCVSEQPCVLFIAFNEPVDAFPVKAP